MPEAQAHPRDPLRIYQFRVGLLPGQLYVAGVQKVSGLRLTVGASEVWEGGNSLHRYANPDRATWEPITLEQGLALDNTLEKWAQAVIDFLKTGTVNTQQAVKRHIVIDIWEPLLHPRQGSGVTGAGGQENVPNAMGDGQDRIRRYQVFNAWISRYNALPALDAMANEVALLSVELVHEGWCVVSPDKLPSDLRSSRAP